MSISNHVALIGNIGGDLQVNQTTTGKTVVSFSLATHERRKDENGNRTNVTEWHNVVCFGSLADLVKNYLSKGDKISVTGTLRTSKYTDKSGVDHFATKIISEDILFLSTKKSAGNE